MLEDDFARVWKELALPGPFVLLLSGGGDSVALFLLLKQNQIDFRAVHFVHDGDSNFSEMSRRFCSELCVQNGIDLEVKAVAGKALVEGGDLSWEAACRVLRYQHLRGRAGSFLTAHTADDQAETVVLRLLGGASLAGLGGIHPVRKDGVARPLLHFTRARLRSYLNEKGQGWLDDPSNVDGNDRARLRGKIMPLLREVQPALYDLLDRTSRYLREDESYFRTVLKSWLTDNSNEQGDSWELQAVRELAPSLRIRLFKQIWTAFSPLAFRPRGTLFRELEKLVGSGRNDSWVEFPGGWAVGVLGSRLWARPVMPEKAWSVGPIESMGAGAEFWQLGEGREVRTRCPGDRFQGRCLKRVLTATKEPPWVRERWPLLVEGSEVLAVWGVAATAGAKEQPTHRVVFEPDGLRGSIWNSPSVGRQ